MDPATKKALELEPNAARIAGINWTWFDFGDNEAAARAFEQWLLGEGFETRGVYEPHGDGGWAVRFR